MKRFNRIIYKLWQNRGFYAKRFLHLVNLLIKPWLSASVTFYTKIILHRQKLSEKIVTLNPWNESLWLPTEKPLKIFWKTRVERKVERCRPLECRKVYLKLLELQSMTPVLFFKRERIVSLINRRALFDIIDVNIREIGFPTFFFFIFIFILVKPDN